MRFKQIVTPNKGLMIVKLKSSLRKFNGRHHDLINSYGISASQMTQSDPFLIHDLSLCLWSRNCLPCQSTRVHHPFLAHLAFRPCELLSSLFVRRLLSVVRPSTFHILIFSSETTGPIATKLWWNGPWMAPFQNCVRWSRLPTKMAAKLRIEKRGGWNFNCPLLL
jgi:hypothetical protein